MTGSRRGSGADRRGSGAESLGGQRLIGDSRQRIKVPMPRSVEELRHEAERHFKGVRGMYQDGTRKVSKPQHVSELKNGDVVVVARGYDERPREELPISTHQEHFVRHPLEARRAPLRDAVPLSTTRFEGCSNYATDYVQHAIAARRPVQPARSTWDTGRNNEPTGSSTYQQAFPWHAMQRGEAYKPQEEYAPDSAPFEGLSSYAADYVRHAVRPRSAVAQHQARAMTPGVFEGDTTYTVDYKRHALEARRQPHDGYGATLRPDPAPFEGATEYNREYQRKAVERPPMIFIEPEIGRTRRPTSAPVGSRGRRTASARG